MSDGITNPPTYEPARWHWRVDGESHRLWSSAEGSWVDTVPDGTPVTSLASIEGLDEVLRRNGFKSPVVTRDDFTCAIQGHVDAVARARLYNDGTALAGYAGSTVLQWAQEACAFVAWRDAVWAYAYGELDKVLAGERGQPGVEDFIAELPAIVWPDRG